MDRLRAFEIFVAVVQRGSFTRAADALDTSPANVTRYVNELEAYLGTRLLNRSSRKLSLTESGEALFERGKSILDDVADAESVATASSAQARGRLRLNAPVSFGIRHLAPLWPGFLQQHPQVELDVNLIDRVVDIVDEGYDLAIRISRSGATSHAARKLASSRNVLVAAPGYLAAHGTPQTLADLALHQCIVYSYTGDEWHFRDASSKLHSVRVNSRLQTNNGDTARSAALAGAGIIWQPTFLVGDDLRAGRLQPLLPDYRMPDTDVLAVYPSRRHLSAKVRVMIDYLVNAFSGVPPWDR
ncbi:HTH-type transcriptional regulator DmlR [Andreprevotia sp. IGB-42]|uniref:LysR family transcriptional regulator n=1 Tax=Andreprevotia sp. IGB-42 TaxID=2497473 RepID=UPI00135AACD7|nr:LysR family transcriptional regulator [Andreprevotia sp. IGB-42]KAF0814968.1 HTH-type transcriptional regulator DmlR [Andreprevotia sp. IGB-42]